MNNPRGMSSVRTHSEMMDSRLSLAFVISVAATLLIRDLVVRTFFVSWTQPFHLESLFWEGSSGGASVEFTSNLRGIFSK